MSFQALQELPTLPPTLDVNGDRVEPCMVDWRTGEPQKLAPAESLKNVTRLAGTPLDAVLANTAAPSGLTVGVYPGSLDTIDPTVAPEVSHDFLAGPSCSVVTTTYAATIQLDSFFPESVSTSVFVDTATYFAETDGTPFADTVVWVFEASR